MSFIRCDGLQKEGRHKAKPRATLLSVSLSAAAICFIISFSLLAAAVYIH